MNLFYNIKINLVTIRLRNRRNKIIRWDKNLQWNQYKRKNLEDQDSKEKKL